MTLPTAFIPPGAYNRHKLAIPGTPAGNAARQAFISDLHAICGDIRFLWLPLSTDGLTTASAWRDARVWTYDATIAARIATLGSLVTVDFDGTDDEADTPDTADTSPGDASVDAPFSLIVLCKPDVNNAAMTLLAKEASATAEEWNFGLNASGHLVVTLTDESASATLTGTYATAVGTVRTLLGMSYTGSGVNSGITNYKDGVAQTTAAGGAGTYVAMENTAALMHLGARYATKERFFNGYIDFALCCFGALSADKHFAIKEALNAMGGLSL